MRPEPFQLSVCCPHVVRVWKHNQKRRGNGDAVLLMMDFISNYKCIGFCFQLFLVRFEKFMTLAVFCQYDDFYLLCLNTINSETEKNNIGGRGNTKKKVICGILYFCPSGGK